MTEGGRMLRVWGRRNSLNVQKVLWLVGELGLPQEHIPAGGDFGRLDEPGFRSMNPHGLVPVIEDGGVAVWESHAILRHLAEAHGGERFWPSLEDRSRIEPWMDWQQTRFQPSFSDGLFWGYCRTRAEEHDWPAIRRSIAVCGRELSVLDRVLAERPFVAGDRFGLADVPIGTCMFRHFALDLPRPELPNVKRWYDGLCERPAYREHVMLPFDDLRGRLVF
jgi:glutathione S-transferase